ncbi:UNVERIFIED_CONTAM: hypothetical protein GTU68_023972 [Idotea baltica]|nr:hypothetical protein [Idotea baltica]
MDIRSLTNVILLSDTLHFGRASNLANISPSAFSRSIQQLEAELNVTLFDRDNRSVALTAEGHKFVRYARDAVQKWEQIRFDLTDPAEQLRGEISLYCSVTASHSILVDLLNRFRPAHPGVEIRLQTGDPQHAIEHVVTLEEDLAIAARPAKLPAGVIFAPILISPLVFIAPKDTSVFGMGSLPPSGDAWAQVPMILAASGIARNRVDAWFKTLGVTPKIYAQVAGNEAIVSMVSLGLGVGVVPQIVLDNSPQSDRVRILEVTPSLEPYDLGLVTMKRNLNNPLVKMFWSLLSTA